MSHHTYSNATKTNFCLKRIRHDWNDWRISKFLLSNLIYYLAMIQNFLDSATPNGPDGRDVPDLVILRIEPNGRNRFYDD